MTRNMLLWLAIGFVLSGAVVVATAWRLAQRTGNTIHVASQPDPSSNSDSPILTEFTLTERSGRSLGTKDLRGQVWVASFFFSSCPGSCRAQNLELLALHNQYAKKGVKFVSITCDPLVDTPAKLSEYAATLGAPADSWYFLTGDLKYIRRVGAEIFRVWVDERGHMDRFIVVDRWGNVRGHFDWHDRERLNQLKHLLDQLLVETEPPANITPVMAVPGALPHRKATPPEAHSDESDTEQPSAADTDRPSTAYTEQSAASNGEHSAELSGTGQKSAP